MRFGPRLNEEILASLPGPLSDYAKEPLLGDSYAFAYTSAPISPTIQSQAVDQWRQISRVAIEGKVDPALSAALSAAALLFTGEELRSMTPGDFAKQVNALKAEGRLSGENVIRFPGHLLPAAVEIPPAPAEITVSADAAGRPFSLAGHALPAADVRMGPSDGSWLLETTAAEDGSFAFDLTGIPEGWIEVIVQQRPVDAIAYSDTGSVTVLNNTYPLLKTTSWTPGDGATGVSTNTAVELTFTSALDPNAVSSDAAFLTSERVGPVYSDVKVTGPNRIAITPRLSLLPNENYRVCWKALKGVDGSRAEGIIETVGQFTTGASPVARVTSIDPATISSATGWAGRSTRLEIAGENLPHGLEMVIGDLLVTDMQWLQRDRFEVWVLANGVGTHPVRLCLPGLLVQTELALIVQVPAAVDFIYGQEGMDGPAGEVHVMVPGAAEVFSPALLIGEANTKVAAADEIFHQEGVHQFVFQVPLEIRQARDTSPVSLLTYPVPETLPVVTPGEDVASLIDGLTQAEIANAQEELPLLQSNTELFLQSPSALFDFVVGDVDLFGAAGKDPAANAKKDPHPRVKPGDPLNSCHPCGLSNLPPDPFVVCVGANSLNFSICVDHDDTLLTVDHLHLGRGTANGGFSHRYPPSPEPYDVHIPFSGQDPGIVDIEVKLWCAGNSISKVIHVLIEDCPNNGGNPGGGGFPPGGAGPGGGGPHTGAAGIVPDGTIDFCGAVPAHPGAPFTLGEKLSGVMKDRDTVTYRFGGVQGECVTFSSFVDDLHPAGQASLHFSLFDENDTFLVGGMRVFGPGRSDVGTVIGAFPLPATGIYYFNACRDVLLSGLNTGYKIATLREPKTPITGRQTGQLTYPGQAMVYSLTRSKGDFIDVSIDSAIPGFIPFFQVYDPDGTALIAPEVINQRYTYTGLFMPKDGEYTVRVATAPIVSALWGGTFHLSVSDTSVTPISRAAGASFSGNLSGKYDAKVFKFSRSEFAYWYVDLLFDGDLIPSALPFLPRLNLLDPDGKVIFNQQANFSQKDIPFTTEGDYYIRIYIRLGLRDNHDFTSERGAFQGQFSFEKDSVGDGIPDHLRSQPANQRPSAPGAKPPSPSPATPPPPSSTPPAPLVLPTAPTGAQPLPPVYIPCPEPKAAVTGYGDHDPGDVFTEGDEFQALAVPDSMVRPPQTRTSLERAWDYNAGSSNIYLWYLVATRVTGASQTYVINGNDVPALGLKFVEQNKNKLRMKVQRPPEIVCLDVRVECLCKVPWEVAQESGATTFSETAVEAPTFGDQIFQQMGSGLACHHAALWPSPDALGVFMIRSGITATLPPRNQPAAEGIQGVYVSNGIFVLPQQEYAFPNFGLPMRMQRTFYGMLDYPNSMIGQGCVFCYDVRLARTADHSVEVRNAHDDGRIATYKYDKVLSMLPVKVTEQNGKPGTPVIDRFDALIDYYRSNEEFSEVLYIRRMKSPAKQITESVQSGAQAIPVAGLTETTTPSPGAPAEECDAYYLQHFKDGTRYRYDCFGRIVWMRDRHRNILQFEYDNGTHPFSPDRIRQTDDAKVHKLGYEQHGGADRIVSVTNPALDLYSFAYNDQGQCVSVTFPIENEKGKPKSVTTKYGYAGEQLETVTSPLGSELLKNTFASSPLPQYILQSQKLGDGTWNFDFAAKTLTTPRQVQIKYELDPTGRLIGSRSLITELDPDTVIPVTRGTPPFTRKFGYNAFSQITRVENEEGVVSVYSFEEKNKACLCEPERFDPSPGITFSDNLAAGNLKERKLTGSKSGVLQWNWEYEDCFSQISEHTNARRIKTAYKYQNGVRDGWNGNPRTIIRPKVSSGFHAASYDRTETLDYNVNGQVKRHEDGAGLAVENTYQPDGQLKSAILDADGLKLTTTYQYNGRGGLENTGEPGGC